MLSNWMIYPAFCFLVITGALLLIPKNSYKKYFLYGLMFGGVADSVIAIFLTAIGLINYKDMGPFSVFDIFSLWTPITWAFIFMIYFYFLPVRKGFLIAYILIFSALNYAVGFVMENFGLFEHIGIYKYLSPITFIIWYSISAWIFIKYEKIELI
ncbi:MAG: hypothetical protein PHZ11_00670 [Desulfitobacteriaceae bacterium]|nr:hypothetical protein [Desulfitobacteriaceae bacterium]MDD4345408.1 hypothetical protein [Desulfitobacteriaceae bacterium]MDD4402101.1 hypothetical protein [Desulfitobacteriaceae bacterium]